MLVCSMAEAVAAKNALKYVLEAKKDENIVIFCDDEKREVGEPSRKAQ